jgi:3-oxoacyl-[acyl-carrier protein] reductase
MSEAEFGGRVALVTGGSRGIGRATACKLAAGGAAVAVNYVSDEDAAAKTCRAIEDAGGRALAVQGDVSDPAAVQAMVAETEAGLGPVDLLVCSAGIVRRTPHDATDFETWRRVMAVNVDGVYLPVMAVKDGMLARGFGRIVCLSSVAGLRPRPLHLAYSSSKAAVIGFVRSASSAFAPDVRINAVAPGLIETDMTADLAPATRQAMIEGTPLKRIGRADEIAEMVLFLLSERAAFTTGQTFIASGGRVTLP